MVLPKGDGNGTPKSRNLLILQRLKQARTEAEAQKNEAPSTNDAQNVVKKFVHKKPLKSELFSSSSSGISENEKLRLIRRSTVQEQLFAAQCQQSRQKFQDYQSTLNTSQSTSSACTIDRMQRPQVPGNSKQRYQKYKRCNNRNNSNNNNNNNNNKNYYDSTDDDNDEVNDNAHGNSRENDSDEESNTVGVLHLKKPLKLSNCEDLNYFNGSSKKVLKDIDWSMINGKKNENKGTSQRVIKNVNFPKETNQRSDVLPIADSDFINFVNNSSNDTVYRIHNNVKEKIKNTSDSPIIKIQKSFNQCKVNAVTVTQEIKEAFEPLQEEPKLIDLIDTVAKKEFPIQDNPSPISRLQNFNGSLNVHSIMHQIQKRNIEDFKRSQWKETKTESVTILSSSNRIAERNKMIDECNDDMFDFVKPNSPLPSSSLVSSSNSGKKFDDIDENSDPELVSRKLIDKVEKSQKFNDISLDSDDISIERSSELDYLSATRRSTNSKYESLRNRLLCNVSTQTSPKKSIGKVNRNLISKNREEVKIDKNEKTLMKACNTRYLKKSAIIIDETVTTEMEKDIPNEEPLLKPVSTRYLSTLPGEEKSSSDSKNEFIFKENVIKTNSMINEQDDSFKLRVTCYEESSRKEIVTKSNEIGKIASDSIKIEEIISDSEEIQEISKNNSVSSSSGESNYSLACKKIETDENSDKTTNSSYEQKDSEESSELNNQIVVQSQLPLNSKEENNLARYEDINSEEEYDVVNFEQFSAFKSLVSKLEALKAAQKEHALGLINELNNNFDSNDSQNNLKVIESSLDNTENNYSSISASISSNLDSDNENSVKSSSSSNLLLSKQNVFENIKIDVEHLNNYRLNEDGISDATKLQNPKKEENKKTELSNRQLKKINALNNYFKSKVPEGGDQAAQKNEDEVQAAHDNEDEVQEKILIAKESKQCDQILEEKTKQKPPINWRAWLGYK